MRSLSRVVWSEGMYLGPHQFQVQGRYFEDSIDFAASSLWFRPFGLTGLTLDEDALRNGTVSLVHARGILPDGTPFHIPQADALPPPRAIAELFPPTADSLTVHLGIPARRPQGPNCSFSANGENGRYIAEMRTFADENTGADERPVRVGKKNMRLMLNIESFEDYVHIPIARVRRDGSGAFAYDPEFVPPCVQISASERLMLMLRRLLEILESKSVMLTRNPRGAGTGDYTTREIANFWLLHAVNSALAPLRHQWISKRGHPEELFCEMSRLGGALCTFALDSHPNTLPLYDHMHLGECFDQLDRHIRTHLELTVPTNCISIPLRKVADYFYEAAIEDTRCLGRARWVFGIQAPVGEAQLIANTPVLVKICSAKFVGELVKRAMAGLQLTHLPVPPSAIPATLETKYFGISREGPFWDHIVQTRRVGLYVPGDFPQAELELFVVLEQS